MLNVWVLYDAPKIGTLRQCEALVKTMGARYTLNAEFVPVAFQGWKKYLPVLAGRLVNPSHLGINLPTSKPDLIITGGRQAYTVALTLGNTAPKIALLNPRVNPKLFDLIITPEHDNLTGDNVISFKGALHGFTEDSFKGFKSPKESYITLLLGGDTKHHNYTSADIERLSAQIQSLLSQEPFHGAKLLITPSRRTNPDMIKILKEILGSNIAECWDGTGENPYTRYLAWAKAIVATGDSINMLSEACFQGKPVYIFTLPNQPQKFNRFQQSLLVGSHAQLLEAPNLEKPFAPLQEWQRVEGLFFSKLVDLMGKPDLLN